jgi:hypothetical protein
MALESEDIKYKETYRLEFSRLNAKYLNKR